MRLTLYGTEFCHLCEQAQAILTTLGLSAEHIDIATNDELYQRYGVRIPVLLRQDTLAELGWPFDVEMARVFLEKTPK